MNTTLYSKTTRPPNADVTAETVVYVPAGDDLRRLAFADRLSLRVGIWLLQRAQRPRTVRRTQLGAPFDGRSRSVADEFALHTYDPQRQLR